MSARSMKECIDYYFYTHTTTELVEYLNKHFMVPNSNSSYALNPKERYIWNTVSLNYICTSNSANTFPTSKFIPTEEFKKLIGMEENMKEFTKDMLVAGKHVVELRDGTKHLVLQENTGELFFMNLSGELYFSDVSGFTDDLLWDGRIKDDFTVIKVYEINIPTYFKNLRSGLKLIWERQEKSADQILMEELEQKQREIADQMAELSKRIGK